ncbi:MAG TPA: YetF domain-containing protein [Candidatus Binatia bacterium]|nr:YetF domain-containing protein [Candidatus Binatia bacterium]
METQILVETAVRSAALYALILFVVRLTGKRTIGNFSAFDLLVALMIGEVVDEIVYGDVPFVRGVVPIVVVAALHEANAWLSYSSSAAQKILEGAPTVIVRDGKLDERGMRSERMTESDVFSHLRVEGVADLAEVRTAVVENDGAISVIRQEWAEPAQKRDVTGAAGPPDGRGRPTDGPEALES